LWRGDLTNASLNLAIGDCHYDFGSWGVHYKKRDASGGVDRFNRRHGNAKAGRRIAGHVDRKSGLKEIAKIFFAI